MVFLNESFQLLTYVGLWKPSTCKTVENISDDIFTFLVIFIVCAKIFGILRWRREISEICMSFEASELELRTYDELKIQKQYNNTIRFYCLAYIIMCCMASSINTLGRHHGNRGSNILPYRIYLPYDYSTPFLYQFTALLQFITVFIAANIDAGFDTLFFGVMVQIISKINILKHRFQVTVSALAEMHDEKSCNMEDYKIKEDKFLKNWIKSHNAIMSLYDDSEFVFSKVIFVQYSSSALPICTIVYLISQMEIFTSKFMGNLVTLIILICQIFIFCFAGNQVTSEVNLSLAIYNTKWFALSVSARKNIIFMMMRTLKPIIFSSGYLVVLSLESFKSVSDLQQMKN
ncbi:hypothetical protein PV325_013286 [Microctonus aethiopoides]|nr:hypothetical protein PV325_013286 [Microctonus aethiopoides]